MPSYTQYFYATPTPVGLPNGGSLASAGPILQVEIHVPAALATVMSNMGQPIPAPVVGAALIDTGAQRSAVNEEDALRLGLNPVGVMPGFTASGPTTHQLYPVRFMFPGTSPIGKHLDVEFGQATGVNLTGQHVGGNPTHRLVALIGRDVLSACVLTYNGAGGAFTLSW